MSTAEDYFLLGLNLRDRLVVVIGGGQVASRKISALRNAHAVIVIISPTITPTIAGLLVDDNITHKQRVFQDGDTDGAWLVIAATDDPSVNEHVAIEANQHRIFCIRTDYAVGGTAVMPAQEKVQIADGLVHFGVLTGSAQRSIRWRELLAQIISHTHNSAVQDISHIAQSESYDKEFLHYMAELPGVAIIGAGPGAADLITTRGIRLLGQADIVIADRLAPQELLSQLCQNALIIDAAKNPYGPAMDQEEIHRIMIKHALEGKFVVRLKGGDPYLFGRGFEEVQILQEHGIPVRVVPGITSALAVPALAGIPVTHRGINHDVLILSGHLAVDDPHSLVNWQAVAGINGTLILMMAVKNISGIAQMLITYGKSRDTPVAVIENGSMTYQRCFRTELEHISELMIDKKIKPPAIIVIGTVAKFIE